MKNKKHSKNRSNSLWRRIRRIPRPVLWIGLVCVIVIYCYVFYSTFVLPYSYRWKAMYGEVTYPPGTVRGIDVSHYQERIDWKVLSGAKLQDAPVSFVFIKATEGATSVDDYFNVNFSQAKKYGITRGAYHFFTTQSSGKEQAENFCKTVTLTDGDLPPVLDIEVDVEQYEGGKEDLKREILDWLQQVEEHYHVTPMIYASKNFKTDYLDDFQFGCYPFWIAHYYVETLEYKGNWCFWQHTDMGHVDGIKGEVDINLFNGDEDDLKALCIHEKP